jgi:curved DNA-binding protein CbpA
MDSKEVPPTDAKMQLLSPDGYYTYLGVPRDNVMVDEDLIKKNYRKLSLKHHPDRNGGDAETFRILNRAQLVLTTPKLRQQYDILGLDLDDEGEDKDGTENMEGGAPAGPTTSQGIVHEIASMALTSVLQMGVRTRKYDKNNANPQFFVWWIPLE